MAYFNFKIPENLENLDEEEIIKNVSDKNGFSVFAHPGRYERSISFYVNLFKKYPNLIGIEVLNPSVQIKKGKIYGDTDIWDEILKNMMPDRPVWGFGNDDFHDITQFSINWNEFLLEKFDREEIKKAMKNGKFYICSAIKGYNMPYLKKILVNEKNGEIEIKCKNYKEIKWISNGKIIGYGEMINYKKNPEIEKYIRVEIYGEKGYIYLNPFGIKGVKNE